MLTADMVMARKQGNDLVLTKFDAKLRARVRTLAEAYLRIAEAQVGQSREEYLEAMDAITVLPKERKLALGLKKLIDDACEFEAEAPVPPEQLRAEVFVAAAAARQAGGFQRDAVLAELAPRHGLTPEALDQALYADLRNAHTLLRLAPLSPDGLAEGFELAQAQAVLLRAARLIVDVHCATPAGYRLLLRKLKFLRLLYTLEPWAFAGETRAQTGYRLTIDGPFSLFQAVTKYGLQLALALPYFAACTAFRLQADIRWGTERAAMTFRLEGGGSTAREAEALPDDVARLLDDLAAHNSPWQAAACTEILHMPGAGLCVPDLTLTHQTTGVIVYVEVLGYWSRNAVWQRVELVKQGLPFQVIFACSSHLRVSEAALEDTSASCLYVYKRVLSVREIIERANRLLVR